MAEYAYSRKQLYDESAISKYPLIDTAGEDIPMDLLLDMSICVDEELMPDLAVTAVSNGPGGFFICLEAGGAPVAHLAIREPEPFKIYVMEFSAKGSGWLVLGPLAASDERVLAKGVEWALDPACVIPNPSHDPELWLEVNGFRYPMPDVLKIRGLGMVVDGSSDRTTVDGDITAATLGRDDLTVPVSVAKRGLIDADFDDMPLFEIADREPDAAGDFKLEFQTNDGVIEAVRVETHSGDPVGLVIQTRGLAGCPDPYARLENKIKDGRSGHGVAFDLPLDETVVEESSSSSYDSELFPSSSSSDNSATSVSSVSSTSSDNSGGYSSSSSVSESSSGSSSSSSPSSASSSSEESST